MSSDAKPAGTTVDQEEVDRFSRLADHWWDETGEFGVLHTMNNLRIPLVRDALVSSSSSASACLPLSGVKILDVGCGGGLLSEVGSEFPCCMCFRFIVVVRVSHCYLCYYKY